MRRRGGVQRRRVVFIGVEGKSDRAFVKFLGHICDEVGLHLHLDAKPASGGDSVAVVEEAGRRLKKHPDSRVISKRFGATGLGSNRSRSGGRPGCSRRVIQVETRSRADDSEPGRSTGSIVRGTRKACDHGTRCPEAAAETVAGVQEGVAECRGAQTAVYVDRSETSRPPRRGTAEAAGGVGALRRDPDYDAAPAGTHRLNPGSLVASSR